MNMFSKDGTRGQEHNILLNRDMLISATENAVPNSEEEAKERLLTEKAAELM